MKTSPLQLDWVTYPKAHFEARDAEADDGSTEPELDVEPIVSFELDGAHLAYLTVKSPEDARGWPYTFHVDVVAQFRIDLESAEQSYRMPRMRLPPIIAANVSRVLFSSAREFLAGITARGPRDALTLPSVVIEPVDVRVGSNVPALEILEKVFLVSADEIKRLREEKKDQQQGAQLQQPES